MKEKEAVCAEAAVGEMSSEQCFFPSRWSGGTQDGMSGLAPDWDAQENTVSPYAVLPWSSPFPVLNYMLWGFRLLAVSPCFSKGDLGALRENQLS